MFNSAQELANAMSQWDPNGDWTVFIDPGTQTITIEGGSSSSDYGVMVVEQSSTGIKVQLGISGVYVPTGHGLLLPFGFHQIVVTDTLKGCTDSVVALVACVNSEVVENTIFTGELDSLCLDFSELPGTPSGISNICPGSGGEIAVFSINDGCVFYFGNEPGPDTACIVVCDDWGVCDTTFLFVTVVEPPSGDPLPVAVNDTLVTQPGHGVVIDVFANDTLNSLQQFFIPDPPGNGQAVFLPGGSVNYLPGQDYCDDDVPDSFTYVICNPAGCDTATVFITVQCTGVEIFNGFSPNGDGVNDFFKIGGLQNYPGHHLQVYNRWGNLVFEATNYQNTWNGTWKDKDLPDGTYFYYLDLGDGSKALSGFVELHR
ncbi:MAG: gliding motility-associated C-terminal domain-containing protein [Saprospiraceae bacterium]